MHTLKYIATIGALLATCAGAQSAPNAWYAGIATGEYFPIKEWSTTYRVGGGGELIFGREIASGWSVQLSVNQWLQAGSQHATWDLKAAPMMRWTGPGAHLRPFALAGVGIDAQSDYPSKTSSGRAMVPLGAGIEVPTSRHATVFLETMYYVLFRDAATRDVPLLLGFRVGFH